MRWKLMVVALWWCLGAGLTGGCAAGDDTEPEGAADQAETLESVALGDASFDVPRSERADGPPLPVWQTEAERERAKEDSFDVRGSYQDIYGVTNPPAEAVRAVAQFEPTDGVLVSWDDWMGSYMVDLVGALSEAAPVWIVTDDLAHSRRVQTTLERSGVSTGDVRFFEFYNDSFWTRDYGPTTVAREDGSAAFVGPAYYPDRRRDDAIPTLMARYFSVDIYRPPLATEGGNFMTNGEGLCAVTDAVLEQNPHLSRQDVLDIKREYYGCLTTIIVERMHGEGTGHIDMFAKFTSRDTVIVGRYSTSDDRWNAAILDRNAERFATATLADGTPLRVERIPMPRSTYPVYRSYTNATIVNDTVVVPTYRADRTYEAQALAVFREVLPGHRIVTIDSEEAIQLGGAVHCTTAGFSLGRLRPSETGVAEPSAPEPGPVAPSGDWESTPHAPIRDFQQTADAIVVGEEGVIERGLTLELELDHTYIGDLVVWLERGNEYVMLHQRAGGSSQDLYRSWFIEAWSGTERGGEWLLVIEDQAQGDEGVLRRWAVSFD